MSVRISFVSTYLIYQWVLSTKKLYFVPRLANICDVICCLSFFDLFSGSVCVNGTDHFNAKEEIVYHNFYHFQIITQAWVIIC